MDAAFMDCRCSTREVGYYIATLSESPRPIMDMFSGVHFLNAHLLEGMLPRVVESR